MTWLEQVRKRIADASMFEASLDDRDDLARAVRLIETYEAALETLKVAVNDKVNDPGATAFIARTLAAGRAIKGEK